MNETVKSGPKDVFLQLGAIIGLYVIVFALGGLLFQIISIYFPDALSYDYGYYARQGLRWPLDILVIFWPIYLWVNSYVQKDLLKNLVFLLVCDRSFHYSQ